MELYLVFSIVDRARARHMLDIYERLHLSAPLTALASGTATMEHLSYNNLEPRPKALVTGVASVADLGGHGGLVSVDRDGNVAMPFASSGLKRAALLKDGTIVSAAF